MRRLPTRPVQCSDYEVEGERSARRLLVLGLPLQILVRFFVRHAGEPWLNGKITGKGIRVGPQQLGHLHRLSLEAAALLDVAPPDLFVFHSASPEPMLLGVGSHNTLALPICLMEDLKEEQLLYLLSREMGHIKSQHVVYWTLLRWIKEGVSSSLRQFALPALALLYRWQRAATLSADRAGLLVGQDLEAASRAILYLVLGKAGAAQPFEMRHLIREGMRSLLGHPFKSAAELAEPSPFLPRRLASLHLFAHSPPYRELFSGS